MVQQILRLFDSSLFDSSLIEELTEEPLESQRIQEPDIDANILLEETQQLFHSDGSEPELVALIQKAIDAIHELCDPTSSPD